MNINIPKGATHFIPPNEWDYKPENQYYKWGEAMWLPESCRWLYCWWFWTGKDWVKDLGFCNRHGKLQEISN